MEAPAPIDRTTEETRVQGEAADTRITNSPFVATKGVRLVEKAGCTKRNEFKECCLFFCFFLPLLSPPATDALTQWEIAPWLLFSFFFVSRILPLLFTLYIFLTPTGCLKPLELAPETKSAAVINNNDKKEK